MYYFGASEQQIATQKVSLVPRPHQDHTSRRYQRIPTVQLTSVGLAHACPKIIHAIKFACIMYFL